MKHKTVWLVLILIAAGLQLLGRIGPSPPKTKKIAPASVSKIEGTDLMRVTLLPEAVKRLDLNTAPVREQLILPTRKLGGEVVSISTDRNIALVRVELTENDVKSLRRNEPAIILPVARESKAFRVEALPINEPSKLGLSERPGTLYYETSSGNHGLVNRQLVLVELALSGDGEKRTRIPYAAVLYDARGNTWVYTNPEPFVFIRRPIRIETIMDDEVLLLDGPPIGTPVVTVGGAELYGTEFGVGK